jgi:hypothetical protein
LVVPFTPKRPRTLPKSYAESPPSYFSAPPSTPAIRLSFRPPPAFPLLDYFPSFCECECAHANPLFRAPFFITNKCDGHHRLRNRGARQLWRVQCGNVTDSQAAPRRISTLSPYSGIFSI